MKKLIYLCGLLVVLLAACLQDIDPLNFAPEVNTGEATDITYTSATLSGTIKQNVNSAVQSAGILVAENESMEAATEIHAPSGNYASFTLNADNLEPGRTYYYCAYASSGYSEVRGDVESFATRAGQPPVLEGMEIVSHDEKSMIVRATVTDEGGSTLGLCGFRYMEATDNEDILHLQGTVTTAQVVNSMLADTITSLMPNTEYIVCAYASNGTGIGYSDILHVMTDEATVPVVSAITPLDSTVVSILVQASVVDAGKSALTDIGFCWSTETPQPTTSHFNQSVKDQLGNETFSWDITNLSADATYYIRAYAVNSQGTGYGDTKVFTTTSSAPVVDKVTATDIQFTSVVAGAKILSHGGLDITQKGFYYSATNENPGPGDTQVIATNAETDSIAAIIEGLASHTTYYIRAYATNSKGTSVGEVTTFTTADDRTVPEVVTNDVTNIGSLTATFSGTVVSDGNTLVTNKGFVYSTDSDPVVNDGIWHSIETDETTFTLDVKDLRSSTTYYICAYAENEIGVSYGEVKSFTTTERVPGIYNADELVAFRDAKNNGGDISAFINSEKIINLHSDIDMSSVADWHGFSVNSSEVFEGNGHTISNVRIYISAANNVTFFNANEGIIRNLTVSGTISMSTEEIYVNFGALLNQNSEGATVENCHSYLNVQTNYNMSGLVGHNAGTIRDCTNHGNIQSTTGAIVSGICDYNEGEIINCRNYGRLEASAEGDNYNGGAAGIVNYHYRGTVDGCINEGEIVADGSSAGIAFNASHTLINCENRASITGDLVSGGICSSLGGDSQSYEYRDNLNNGTVNGEPGNEWNEIGYDSRNVENDPNVTVPILSAVTVSDITASTATLSAMVTDMGGAKVNEYGFFFSATDPMPAEGGYMASVIVKDANIVSTLNYLDANTKYYVRAYAKNNKGIGYSEVFEFTTKRRPGIWSVEDLVAYRDAKNGVSGEPPADFRDADGVVRLYTNLDLSPIGNWTPINQIDATEVFDGNGYNISVQMSYNGEQDMCLIRTNEGKICNLYISGRIEVPESMSTTDVYIGTFCMFNYGEMNSCHNNAEIYAPNPTSHCGALTRNNYGLINYCSNHGSATALIAGGIVESNLSNGQILNCANYSPIVANNDGGGIVGGINYGTISSCINEGSVSVQSIGGGISARIQGGSIVSSENRHAISGRAIGGIVGSVELNERIEISGNINTGSVSGTSADVGGICGGISGDAEFVYTNNNNIGTVNGEPGSTENEIGSDNRQ